MKSYSEELYDLRERERELFMMLPHNGNSYVYSELMKVQDRIDEHKDVIRKSNWKIEYKDHYEYMVKRAGTKEQKQYSKERNFVISAENGDLEKCKLALDQGIDINANNNRGTALGVAARNGHIELCKYLISKGANIDIYTGDSVRETPLMLAAENGNIDICILLLHHGANVNAITDTGRTLRDYAKNLKIVSLLEEHGLVKLESKEKSSIDLAHSNQETIIHDVNVSLAGQDTNHNQDTTDSNSWLWCTIC